MSNVLESDLTIYFSEAERRKKSNNYRGLCLNKILIEHCFHFEISVF